MFSVSYLIHKVCLMVLILCIKKRKFHAAASQLHIWLLFCSCKTTLKTYKKYGVPSRKKYQQSFCTFLVKFCHFYHPLKFLNQELWLPSPAFINKNPPIYLKQLKFVNDHFLRHAVNIKFSSPFLEYFFTLCCYFQVAILVI